MNEFFKIFIIPGGLLLLFMFLSLIRLIRAAYEEVIYIDVAIVYALLSYIGTLYVAKYLEGGSEK
jgi:multicomponent Na+:H+ antiporter subunit F